MRNFVHGTPEQFEDALKNKIQELGGSVQEDVTSAAKIDNNKERYIHTLIGDIQSELQSEVNSITFDTDDDGLIINIVYKDSAVREFHVPFSDLHYDFDEIDADVSYVINALLYDRDTYDEEINREYADDVISESSVNSRSSKFGKVLGSANYYDYPKYSKTLYLPSIRQGKVKLTIGTFSDPRYDDEHMFEILAIVDVEARRDDFTLDSEKLYKELDIRDGHEKLSGYDDRYDDLEGTIDEIYDYFMTLDQDDIDDTLIELADDFDVNRVKQMFGPLTASSQLTKVTGSADSNISDYDDEYDEISFDEWYRSEEGESDGMKFVDKLESLVKSNYNVDEFFEEPSTQGHQGSDFIWITLSDGNKYEFVFDWYDEQSAIYTDGPGAAAKSYFQKIQDGIDSGRNLMDE